MSCKGNWTLTLESWERAHGTVEGAWAGRYKTWVCVPASALPNFVSLGKLLYFTSVVDWFAKMSTNSLSKYPCLSSCLPRCLYSWPRDLLWPIDNSKQRQELGILRLLCEEAWASLLGDEGDMEQRRSIPDQPDSQRPVTQEETILDHPRPFSPN